nr:ubiquitin fusion degradation protein 1 homolog [Tanacetum cinerariifolium]
MDLVDYFDPTLFAGDYYVGETDGGTISTTMQHTADWFTEAVQPHVETFSTTDTENPDTELHSHCGVIEFTVDEGVVFMPKWMMENMKLQDGEAVNIENTSLLQGTYIKFTMLSDHKSLLEKAFKDFACLTSGDTIVINHEDEKF